MCVCLFLSSLRHYCIYVVVSDCLLLFIEMFVFRYKLTTVCDFTVLTAADTIASTTFTTITTTSTTATSCITTATTTASAIIALVAEKECFHLK